MKIYMMTDMEGASGVSQEAQVLPGEDRYEEGRLALTRDVNAAVTGARQGHADEILVCDGHGGHSGYTLVYEELTEGAQYVLGAPWDSYEAGLDATYDAMFGVAMHALAGTVNGVLDHTMSSRAQVSVHLNDVLVGEIGICAAIAGHFDVPLTLISGDEAACREVKELLGPGVLVAPVKEGLRRHSAICLAPGVARALITERAAQAVEAARRGDVEPWRLPSPTTLRAQWVRTDMTEGWRKRLGDGIEMPDARTVLITRDTGYEAIQVYCGYA